VILSLIGLALGLLLGVLGGGGSILTVPALVYAAGLAPKTAIAMSFAVVGTTSAIGAVLSWRAGNVRPSTTLAFGAATLVGAFGGARLAAHVRGDVQLMLLALVMLAAATAMLRAPVRAVARPIARPVAHPIWLAVTGMSVGVLTGLVGIGGGFVIVPALTALAGLSMAEAVGTSLSVIAVNSASGFAGTLGHVTIPWRETAIVAATAAAGILIGYTIGKRVPAAQLKRFFAVFLLAVACFVLYSNRSVLMHMGSAQ
jgi:uncharacterized membrane protein YfcA